MNYLSYKKYFGFLINNVFLVLVVGIPLLYSFLNDVSGNYVLLNNYKEVSKLFVFLLFVNPEIILTKGLNGNVNLVRFYVFTLFIFLAISGLFFSFAPFNISFLVLLVVLNLFCYFFYSNAVSQNKLSLYLFAQGGAIIVSSGFLFFLNIELLSFYFLYSFLLTSINILLFNSVIKNVSFSFAAYCDYFRSFTSYYSKYFKFALVTVVGIIVTLYSRYYFQDLYGILNYERYDIINSTITLLMGVLSQSYISFKLFATAKVNNYRNDIIVLVFFLFCLLAIVSLDDVSLRLFNLKMSQTALILLFSSESIKLITLKYTIHFINNDKYGTLGFIALSNLFFVGIIITAIKYIINDFLVAILFFNLILVMFNLVLSYFIFVRMNKSTFDL